ncbi:MAG: DUF1064 domain-containing protein [Paracoccaceae bacterium]
MKKAISSRTAIYTRFAIFNTRKPGWACKDCRVVNPTKGPCLNCGSEKYWYLASKPEQIRFGQLCAMERRGEIQDLRFQVAVPLDVLAEHHGKYVTVATYRADAVYSKDGNLVVEDVKGKEVPITRESALKMKLFNVTMAPVRVEIVRIKS